MYCRPVNPENWIINNYFILVVDTCRHFDGPGYDYDQHLHSPYSSFELGPQDVTGPDTGDASGGDPGRRVLHRRDYACCVAVLLRAVGRWASFFWRIYVVDRQEVEGETALTGDHSWSWGITRTMEHHSAGRLE